MRIPVEHFSSGEPRLSHMLQLHCYTLKDKYKYKFKDKYKYKDDDQWGTFQRVITDYITCCTEWW